MVNGFIYARVSPTTKSYRHDNYTNKRMAASIASQLEYCRAEAKKDNITIISEFKDEYISGKAQEYMIAFQNMMELAKNKLNSGDKIYVARVDRFGRNVEEMLAAMKKLKDMGISVKFVQLGMETIPPNDAPFANAINKILIVFLSAFAEMQREDILIKTRIGRDIAYQNNPDKFGRPKAKIDWKVVKSLLASQENGKYLHSWSEIARQIGVSTNTLIGRYRKEFGDLPMRRI